MYLFFIFISVFNHFYFFWLFFASWHFSGSWNLFLSDLMIVNVPQLSIKCYEKKKKGTDLRFMRRTYHSMGPNYMWHVDSYDRVKPFGLALSGCIDGFSSWIMWLVCGANNNNPLVITYNYIQCAKSVGVIPMRLRTDLGTENGTMAAIQCTLRHHHTDYFAGESSHSYGSSAGNQRIESWWSFFRKGRFVNFFLMD